MFRKFILVILYLNSYKTLAGDKKSEYVINNSIYIMDNDLLDIMESFKDKDSLVNKKKYTNEDNKEKLLKPIYFEESKLDSMESKNNQPASFLNNKNQTDVSQPDYIKLDQIYSIVEKIKFLKNVQLKPQISNVYIQSIKDKK